MTPRKAAEVIGCTTKHVHSLIRTGKLQAKRAKSVDNRFGYVYSIIPSEARRYRDKELNPRGWPRGKPRSK